MQFNFRLPKASACASARASNDILILTCKRCIAHSLALQDACELERRGSRRKAAVNEENMTGSEDDYCLQAREQRNAKAAGKNVENRLEPSAVKCKREWRRR
mmetsp:Transcript_17682/g.35672  ORF Transcript_17682/g.35672 Transcript_17682/m.35672 type:complete len:102 (-) Transcript_17682:506-811(-)